MNKDNIFVRGKVSFKASQTQFSLFMAWPLTIHKSQGLSLPEMVVDMAHEKGRYNKGQAYAAFRHVTMLDKLFIKNYMREQIYVSGNVKDKM